MRHSRLSSVRLATLLAAGIWCGSGILPADGQQNPSVPVGQPGATGKQATGSTGKGKASPPGQKEKPPVTQYGDITLKGATSSDYEPSNGSLHFVGAHTEINVPDTASKSVLTVHADDIHATKDKGVNLSLVVLNGNVRYHLVQKTAEGERILDGTAGHAVLRRNTQQMEFSGGVNAKLTDAAHFSGPALLRTGTLNVAMETKPFRYHLAGDAANNDILFTPLQAAPAKAGAKSAPPVAKADAKPEPLTPVGPVHIYHFRTGELQFGKSFHMQGPGSTGDFASVDQKTAWHLVGDAIEGEFVPDESDLQRATVTDNVQFHIVQPSADQKSVTKVHGTASQASYVRTQTGAESVLHWPIDITYDDPVRLVKPGTLTAGKGATLTLTKSDNGFKYHLDDPNYTQNIDFILKPTEPAPPTPTPPTPVVPPVPK